METDRTGIVTRHAYDSLRRLVKSEASLSSEIASNSVGRNLSKSVLRSGVRWREMRGMVRFRPNVAALVVDAEGKLLICERWNVPGAWQFPQGGVDAGETAREALVREVREEIGLPKSAYRIVESRDGYRYLYPEEVRRRKVRKHGFHGQEQTYFLCRLEPGAPEINVDQKPREFGGFRWIDPADFSLEWVAGFKREVYRQVMEEFFGVVL
jgi:putative (di)nucleoside polyphosphate hydrolase